MIRIACWIIWRVAAFLGIPLGRFSPCIFGGMLGRRGLYKQRSDEKDLDDVT